MAENATAERTMRCPPFAAPSVVALAVIDGGDPAAIHRLSQRETVVGRGPEADFIVDDEEISKQHFRLQLDGGMCSILDLGSLNGTVVNGRRLRERVSQRLRHLDEIQAGDTRFFVLAGRFKLQRRG
jgi:predicted component of type VI protein secretion system